jgi:curli biogenesis system outer membrane secretion channel CsgG
MTRRQMVSTIAALLAAVPSRSLGQNVRRVALVCVAGDADSQSDLLRFQTRLGGALLRTGRFSLVDRDRLDRLIREQGLSNSDYADPHLAAKLGKLAGAQALLNIQLTTKLASDQGTFVTTLQCDVSANFSLVDVSTGRIAVEDSSDGDSEDKISAGTNTVSSMVSDGLRRQAIDSCVEDMVQKLVT